MPPRNLSKISDKPNMKNYKQYDHIRDTGQKVSGAVSIIIRKNVPQSKININIQLETIAASANLHKAVSVCFLHISPYHLINERKLNDLINKLPKTFNLMGDFYSKNIKYKEVEQ